MITLPPDYSREQLRADLLITIGGYQPGTYYEDGGSIKIEIAKLTDTYMVTLILAFRTWKFFYPESEYMGKAVTA
ncbi:hypothetical protein HQ865_01335 [Mucilaginibacter mali]|uniref:Uncharacterized protein n=1 Tax=Mucilaginibacter mali TaxID=2740462 RepID=A0A7D4U8U0_9SPHI|nr:hypothetical protein [Mucilaginibacter mali]QKJ28458.1 hypothetical protein HQ865_01335 [Mucilaginibacter mali]